MRRTKSIVLLVALLAITPVLAGCSDFDIDQLDVFGLNKKKKLPGERHELFPNGVPGVTQGIPPEYLKGYQESADSPQTPIGEAAGTDAAKPDDKTAKPDEKAGVPAKKTAAIEPAAEPKLKPKPKRKPKPRVAARPATAITVKPAGQGQNGDQEKLEPWPGTTPSQPAQQPATGQSSSTAPWPSSPPPDTFSH